MNARCGSRLSPTRGRLLEHRRSAFVLALAAALSFAPLFGLGAQATTSPIQPPPQGAGPAAQADGRSQPGTPYSQPALQGGGGGGDLQRQQLEQRVRQRFEQIVRQRLQLTDEQVVELRQTNQHFAASRRALAERERGLRQAMRRELREGGAGNQAQLAAQIDSIFALQRTRLDMLVSEQRELSRFLTPAQRVQYYALQEQLRQRVEQLRRQQQMRTQMGMQPLGPYAPGGAGGGGGGGRGRPGAASSSSQPLADTLRP